MYNFTVKAINLYNTDEVLSDAVAHVYDNASGTELTAVGGVYTIDEGNVAKVEFAKTGFQSETAYFTISSDNYVAQKRLTPTYTYRFQWKQYSGQNDAANITSAFTAKIYTEGGTEPVATCTAHNSWGYCYFTWDRPLGTSWYVVAESDDYYTRQTTLFSSTVTDTNIPPTWSKQCTLVTPTFEDLDGQTLYPNVTVRNVTARVNEEYSGEGSVVHRNGYLQGYLFGSKQGGSAYKHQLLVYAELNGSISVYTHDFYGEDLETYSPVYKIYPAPEYVDLRVSVKDKDTEQPIDADVVVTDLLTQEVVEEIDGVWTLIYNHRRSYRITVTKNDYITYTEDITPTTSDDINIEVDLQKIYRFCDLTVNVEDEHGDPITPSNMYVRNNQTLEIIEPEHGVYEVIYNNDYTYTVYVNCGEKYADSYTTITPTSEEPIDYTVTMERLPYATLEVNVIDAKTEEPLEAEVEVFQYNLPPKEGHAIEPIDGVYDLLVGREYDITVTKEGYITYKSDKFTVEEAGAIVHTVELTRVPTYAALTVLVVDVDGNPIPAEVTVYDQTEKEIVVGPPYSLLVGNEFDITAEAEGYDSKTTDIFEVNDQRPIKKTITLIVRIEPFATIKDYELQTGKTVTEEDEARIQQLLEDVSDLIREEGYKVGIDVDAEIAKRPTYATVVRMVTIDVVNRVLNQTAESAAYSQESQSALGYSWSGTYAVAGGGVAMSLMNNELKRLGFNRHRIRSIQLWQHKRL